MFAYCGNNPICYSDPTGYCTCTIGGLKKDFSYAFMCPDCGYASGDGGGALVLHGLIDLIDNGVMLVVSYVYRQYTRYIKATTYGMSPGGYPVTHHIIPYGKYSKRNDDVKVQLQKAQDIMIRVGVDPKTDLINQLPLSATYHATLHTDTYIMMVTAPIVALGEGATIEQIYAVLYNLRIIIAACDQYAWGY